MALSRRSARCCWSEAADAPSPRTLVQSSSVHSIDVAALTANLPHRPGPSSPENCGRDVGGRLRRCVVMSGSSVAAPWAVRAPCAASGRTRRTQGLLPPISPSPDRNGERHGRLATTAPVGHRRRGANQHLQLRRQPVFRTEGAEVIRTPIRAPRANAYAERWVQTVRGECLDWTLVRGRRHLLRLLRVYVRHYNEQRPHRGLALRVPLPGEQRSTDGRAHVVRRRDVLGGLIHEYQAVAA